MKRYVRVCALDGNTDEEEFLELGKSYLIKKEEERGAYIYVNESRPNYFIFDWQYEALKYLEELTLSALLDKLTLGMLLSKLNEDASINLEISFEDEATKIISENYYKDELKDYFDREVKWYSPDTVIDGLSILLEGEFSNGN